MFSQQTCSLCDDDKLAKTGVCINCDAGMCRTYFHATCAQIHGLLSEPAYSAETPDHYLAHCKIHTDKTVIKKRRQSCLSHLLQTKNRLAVIQVRTNNTQRRNATVSTWRMTLSHYSRR